jgi:hypothetical protein
VTADDGADELVLKGRLFTQLRPVGADPDPRIALEALDPRPPAPGRIEIDHVSFGAAQLHRHRTSGRACGFLDALGRESAEALVRRILGRLSEFQLPETYPGVIALAREAFSMYSDLLDEIAERGGVELGDR